MKSVQNTSEKRALPSSEKEAFQKLVTARLLQESEPALEARDLSVGYDKKIVIPSMAVSIPKGKITTIIGPNGCGKSTLLKALARVIPHETGTILINGQPMESLQTTEIARQMALLPQGPQAPAGLKVEDLVSYGRYPYQKGLGRLSAQDYEIIHKAMEQTGTLELKDRSIDELSGGQRQRVWIAMCLAQDTPIILLDEPTAYLDMAHQLEILQLLEKLNRQEHKTIALVIHDLNLAARFSDWMIAMRNGRVLHEGNASAVMTAPVLREVFSLEAYIEPDPWTGRPTMVTYRLVPDSEKTK